MMPLISPSAGPRSSIWREFLLPAGIGLGVLAFVVFAVLALSRQAGSSGGVEGTIVAKSFTPQPETQITVDREGVSSRQIAGEYSFQVRVPTAQNRVYKVTVDPVAYRAHAVGGRYYLVLGPGGER